jgi:hypothetical protein
MEKMGLESVSSIELLLSKHKGHKFKPQYSRKK